MIDNATIAETLNAAWNSIASSTHYYHSNLHKAEEEARKEFYKRLKNKITSLESPRPVTVDEVIRALRAADPDLNIRMKDNGATVDTHEDLIVINGNTGGHVSVFIPNRNLGWDVSLWDVNDLARALVAMGSFDRMSEVQKEEWIRVQEKKIKIEDLEEEYSPLFQDIRESLSSALKNDQDEDALRDQYISLKKEFNEKSGNPNDEDALNQEWMEFLEDTAEEVLAEIREEARQATRQARVEARQNELDEYCRYLSDVLRRPCVAFRCTPWCMDHWEEYIVQLDDRQSVRFKDYTRRVGSLHSAILEMIPALDAFLPFASSRLSLGPCSSPYVEYMDLYRQIAERDYHLRFGEDEAMQDLAKTLKETQAHIILRAGKRSVRLYCFYPNDARKALSFSLRPIHSFREIAALARAVEQFHLTQKKYNCEMGITNMLVDDD